jgi:hypothetical protein
MKTFSTRWHVSFTCTYTSCHCNIGRLCHVSTGSQVNWHQIQKKNIGGARSSRKSGCSVAVPTPICSYKSFTTKRRDDILLSRSPFFFWIFRVVPPQYILFKVAFSASIQDRLKWNIILQGYKRRKTKEKWYTIHSITQRSKKDNEVTPRNLGYS